jgi:hypothetical protein
MTNNPFDPEERAVWDNDVPWDPRFRTALRVDNLFVGWPDVARDLTAMGFPVTPDLSAGTRKAITEFLEHWIAMMNPLYVMASLPPDFTLPDEGIAACVLQEVVLPLLAEKGLPFALMIGCRRQINPAFRLAGDGVGKMDIATLIHLARSFPQNRFLVTLLSRENQHELCITARKFNNLMPFGCWWYMNSPELIDEISRVRLEWLGTSMIPQHSDARVLDQIIYKWNHTKELLVTILTQKYGETQDTGWEVRDSEIERDVRNMFRDNFWNFIGGER